MKIHKPRLPTKEDVKMFIRLFLCQLVMYFLYGVSIIVLTQRMVVLTFFVDTIYAYVAYYLIKLIVENRNGYAQFGYVMGGAWGSVLAIFITKKMVG